ncbi:NAD-dependent epimerase/dehydratase family protein [Mangrovicella endophytica]|uniref:NAD-dependent epimerase/dehydratase family protein n=1 Tax=Mangrovicella endophytica TaxID=2066697 RepID=UPI000C9DB14F|nr:NAD-dependent epimerase/dehydratase family protein [Mangrovicella endophytica]
MMVSVERPQSRAVILGASGFIGINLAHALIAAGYDVTCFARSQSPHWPPACRVILGDFVGPPAALLDAMRSALVFHLVSSSRPSADTAAAATELAANAGATAALLEETKDLACRWVFASSGGTVYGQPSAELIAETHPTEPISSYGIVKLAIEKYFALYGRVHSTDYAIARIANPYGPWQKTTTGQGVVAALFDRVANKRTIEIWGDGGNIRDFVHVDDAVAALIAIGEGAAPGRVYNVGSGRGTTVVELAGMIGTIVGTPADLVFRPARGIDVRRNVLDIGRIKNELGWQPRLSLQAGLEHTHCWLRGAEKKILQPATQRSV